MLLTEREKVTKIHLVGGRGVSWSVLRCVEGKEGGF